MNDAWPDVAMRVRVSVITTLSKNNFQVSRVYSKIMSSRVNYVSLMS